MNLREAISYAEELGIESAHLDETIHELKLREASQINNGGLEEQIKYLIECFSGNDIAIELTEIANSILYV